MNPDLLFFTSDTHFGHKAMVERRGFTSIEQMDAELVEAWNRTVPPEGKVFHLGDVHFHRPARAGEILKQLNGEIHLVTGNHDSTIEKPATAWRFASITPMHGTAWIRMNGQKIIMCHFPYAVWYAAHHGTWHLHGHSHGSAPEFGRRYDVGVDCNLLRPVSFRDLERYMAKRPIEIGDGHKVREGA